MPISGESFKRLLGQVAVGLAPAWPWRLTGKGAGHVLDLLDEVANLVGVLGEDAAPQRPQAYA